MAFTRVPPAGIEPATRGLATMERPARSASMRGSSTTMGGRSHMRGGRKIPGCTSRGSATPPTAWKRMPGGSMLGSSSGWS